MYLLPGFREEMMHISELSAQMPELHWCHFSMCCVERKSSIFITPIIRGAKWTHCFWHLFRWLNLKFHAGKKKSYILQCVRVKVFFNTLFYLPLSEPLCCERLPWGLGIPGVAMESEINFVCSAPTKTNPACTHTRCNQMLQISVLSAGLGRNNMM